MVAIVDTTTSITAIAMVVVVLTAHFTGNRFSKNVYDVLVGTALSMSVCLL